MRSTKVVIVLFALNLIWLTVLFVKANRAMDGLNESTKQILDITQQSYINGCYNGHTTGTLSIEDSTAFCKNQSQIHTNELKEILNNDNE